MAVFNVHPKGGLSSITCSLLEDTLDPNVALTYYLVKNSDLDFMENKRENLVYSPDTGKARAIDVGAVKIKVPMMILGTTQAIALSNTRTIITAFRNPLGGYIEYRPYGVDTAMTTWYHYMRSPAPRAKMKAVAFSLPQMEAYGVINPVFQGITPSNEDGIVYGVQLDFEVAIRPWATSDPTDLQTIVTGGNTYNCDDGSHNNYLVVNSTDIKGDVLFPVIGAGDLNTILKADDVFVCRHRMREDNMSNAFFIEAEDCTLTSFTSEVDASASDGNVARCTGASGSLVRACSALTGLDSAYKGMFVPLIAYKMSDGSTTYSVTFSILDGVVNEPIWTSQAVSIGSDEWRLLTTMEEVRFPPTEPPDYLDDSTSPTVGAWMGQAAQFKLNFTRTAGSGSIDVDFIFLAKADQGIGLFRVVAAGSYIDGASYMILDTFSNSFRLEHTSGHWVDPGEKEGSEITDFIMEKGYDHRVYFFVDTEGSDFGEFEAVDMVYTPDIFGIYGTIYPFTES